MRNDHSYEDYLQSGPCNEVNFEGDILNGENNINWERTDMEGIMIDESLDFVDIDTLMEDTTDEFDEETK